MRWLLSYDSQSHHSRTRVQSVQRQIFQWQAKKRDINPKSVVNIVFFEMHSLSTDFAKQCSFGGHLGLTEKSMVVSKNALFCIRSPLKNWPVRRCDSAF